MVEIKLPRGIWQYDSNALLGRKGGFGEVFLGTNAEGSSVAIKRLYLRQSEAAHRELRIADDLSGRTLKFVIPIYDAGQDTDSDYYFIVMARAEKSLSYDIGNIGPLPEKDTVLILRDIVLGLTEVHDLVHRDLKPDNVLYHDGTWKLADFGIARFVEESTSLNTLKNFLSSPYAAPEQWNLESAVPATDIYALGCIGYALLTGSPPFQGPSNQDFREQHLHQAPPKLPDSLNPELLSLLYQMLRKPAETRIDRDRVLQRLTRLSDNYTNNVSRSGLNSLASAGLEAAHRQAQEEAEVRKADDEENKRNSLAEYGFKELNSLVHNFAEILMETADIEKTYNPGQYYFLQLRFEEATLSIKSVYYAHSFAKSLFANSGWDVIAGAAIEVEQHRVQHYLWSANLWYMDPEQKGAFRWYEVSYFINPLAGGTASFAPFAITEFNDILAANQSNGRFQRATSPRPIDDEDFDGFCDRWAELFADAHQGRLTYPPSLPLS